jgi:UDP-N-acetylglucosamine--N-acetylmuramyl-(pentapeptide) pyrophosphoryl-undecaprenol N-acetylglucosamine transferase
MRVLIVTGLSGGHIFPALALAEALKSSQHQVRLVLPKDGRMNRIPLDFMLVEYIHAANLSFKLDKKNIRGVYFFVWGAWQALQIIIKFKPLVVVGFGSLNSISLVFWAWLFRIKTVIHEQNVVFGKANRLLSKLVDRVAVSFSQTRGSLNGSGEKIIFTGNPLRKDLVLLEKKTARDFFKLKEGKFTILITGGSQGAQRLNATCFEALSDYQKNLDLQVIHISGAQDFTWLAKRYADTTLTYKLFDFLALMQYAYSAADLIICRAGATTIAELQKFKVPAILVPYPFAYAHQSANAQVLKDVGAAEIILDIDLTADRLKERLQDYFCNKEKLAAMQKAYQKLPVLDATSMLVNLVLANA